MKSVVHLTRGRAVNSLLALVVVGFLVAAVLVHRDDRRHWWAVGDRSGFWNASAVAVAVQETKNFFSLDAGHVSRQIDATVGLATGTFAQQYAQTRAALTKSVTTLKLTWVPTIPSDAVAVEYAGPTGGVVLVSADVSKQQGSATPMVERERVRVTLTRRDGQWLVSNFEDVG